VAEAELLVALNPNRIRAVSSVTDTVTRMRQRVTATTAALRHLSAPDALAGRINDLAADTWMPQILLAAHPDQAGQAALTDLNTDLAHAGRCAMAVAVTTEQPIGTAKITITA